MKKPEFSKAALKEFLFVRHRFWVILLTLFCVSQVINIWAGMPDFAQWNFVFGFPFAYLYWKNADGFIYFNLLVLLVDLLIVYLVFRAYLYARYQTNKFEIPKGAKDEMKQKDKQAKEEKEKKEREKRGKDGKTQEEGKVQMPVSQ